MRISAINRAVKDAREFIKRADIVLKSSEERTNDWTYPSKDTGSLRRQSMELTRALAEMRKS